LQIKEIMTNLEDQIELIQENATNIGIAACLVIALISVFTGDGDFHKKAQSDKNSDRDAKISQQRAEKIYNEQGVSAQVLNAETRTASFISGDKVFDPMSVTPENPHGTIINSGYIASTEGAVFEVNNGIATLIGTSPRIRNDLVARGAGKRAKEMEAYAKQIYSQASINSSFQPQYKEIKP